MDHFDIVEQLKLELIRAYEPMVRTIAGLTGSLVEDAREAFHASICRMLAGLRKRPPEHRIVAWRTYIVQVAVNQLREKSRQIARRKHNAVLFSDLDADGHRRLMEVPDPRPTPAAQIEQDDDRAILWSEVAKLSPRQAEVLKRWAHGASFLDISFALGIKDSTVRKLWSKGIRHLQKRPRIREMAA